METNEVLIKELNSENYSSDLIELSKDFFHEEEWNRLKTPKKGNRVS